MPINIEPTPNGRRYVHLTLEECRLLEEYWRRSWELFEELAPHGLERMFEKAAAAGLPFRQEVVPDFAQDMVLQSTRLSVRTAMHNQEVLRNGVAARMKRECGVQLDPTEVKRSVRAMLKDIRNSLDL